MKFSAPSLTIVAALAVALVAAPSRLMAQQAAVTPSAEGIVVYNAQHASLTQAWAAGFTHDTGIKVTLRNGSDTELGNQIVQEGAASPADVFLTENSPAMTLVQAAGLFAPLQPETLAQVPDSFKPATGRWIGIAARSTVFAYNPAKLPADQLPASLLDLASPAWKGRWAAAPEGADFQAIVSALLAIKGPATTLDWLKGMKANAIAYRSNSVALKAVNAGEVPGAIIYHYYFFGDRARTGENSNNTALHYFRHGDPGAFVSLSGGGVLASGKHQAEAQAFLRWLTGSHGQEILRSGNSFEYAVGVDAASNPALVPLADLQAPAVEPSSLNSKAVVDLMTQAGLL
jgi:iron(III) transport system substrate-binding protein